MSSVDKLINGYKDFHKKHFIEDKSLYSELYSKGQFPKTMAIACSDSRVSPTTIMNAEPGEIFTVRNVANLVPPYQEDSKTYHGTSSALEFAVKSLQVENIVIIGHSECGGINALLNSDLTLKTFSFIYPWVNIAEEAKNKTFEICKKDPNINQNTCCEKESILISLRNLMTFPWIKERVESEQLKLHAWYFCIKDGSLSVWDAGQNSYIPV